MQVLAQLLDSVQVGPGVTAGGLSMFPLVGRDADPAPAYLLLDDAMRGEVAEVTEVSQGGSVPFLKFTNRGNTDILLLDGEELVGAKQNRVLNLTILVGAGQVVEIPVSCVEAGRWAWRSRRFESGGRKLHARARARKAMDVSAAMARSGTRSGGEIQSRVWREIDSKMDALLFQSATSSLHDAYDSREATLADLRKQFTPVPHQVGAAFAIGGTIVGIDLYDRHETLVRILPKLVDSHAFDAIEKEGKPDEPPPSLEEVRHLLHRIAVASSQEYPAIAKGTDVRIEGGALHAAALVADGRVAHLAAFAAAQDDSGLFI